MQFLPTENLEFPTTMLLMISGAVPVFVNFSGGGAGFFVLKFILLTEQTSTGWVAGTPVPARYKRLILVYGEPAEFGGSALTPTCFAPFIAARATSSI